MKLNDLFLMEDSITENLIKKHGLTKVGNSIGYSEKDNCWYGWSHRACCPFKIGDKIFEPDFGDDETDYRKHGKATIKSDADMQKAAKAFSSYMS